MEASILWLVWLSSKGWALAGSVCAHRGWHTETRASFITSEVCLFTSYFGRAVQGTSTLWVLTVKPDHLKTSITGEVV